MLIVAIAWLYVVVLMSATQPTWLAALGTLFFYGLFPLSIVLYLMATPARRRQRRALEAARSAAAESPPPADSAEEGIGENDDGKSSRSV